MVDISDTAAITGPFNLEPMSSTKKKISKVICNDCNICHKTCTHSNMLLQTLIFQTSHQTYIQILFKTRKIKPSAN